MTIHRGRKNSFLYLVLPFILVTPFAVFQSANAADTQKKVVVQTSVIKKAGRVTDSTNTIMSGKVAPAASLGLVGDLYIDVASMNFYGPKLATKWPTPVSLKGPAGPMGPSGVDGKTGSTLSGVKGETGATGATGAAGVKGASGDSGSGGGSGPTGPTGPAGAAGVAGVAGVAGPAGAAGVAGAAGSNGTKGDPGLTGSTGSQGNQGIQGNQGNPGGIGSKGDTGTKGDTGLTGSQGVQGDTATTEVQFLEISPFNLSSNASNSSAFGNFAAGTSYEFSAVIYAQFSLAVFDPGIGAEVVCLQSCSFFKSLTIGSFGSFSKGVALADYEHRGSFTIQGVFTTSNSSAKLQVNVFDVMGTSGTYPMVLSGNFLIHKVGTLIR